MGIINLLFKASSELSTTTCLLQNNLYSHQILNHSEIWTFFFFWKQWW